MTAHDVSTSARTKTALIAGGCFWCIEADMKKLPGVTEAYSGYAGGNTENPTYENYAAGGHREVVEVTYDPSRITFAELITYFIQHIDPTDAEGSFHDRGHGYTSAVFYESDEEKRVIEEVLAEVDSSGVFEKPLAVAIAPRPHFWPAEEYHQKYYEKNAAHYARYREASGRDAFRKKHFGSELRGDASREVTDTNGSAPFNKPAHEELRKRLTPLQYHVTQEEGTEPAFQNEYHDEHREGIYVDVVSGEPLFSSRDKYDSGTGWPSFVKPIAPDALTTKEDRKLFSSRTEVRSRGAGSHLGHVFDDGPTERGGKRYCMNSAALRFVPKERLEEEGYGEYATVFE